MHNIIIVQILRAIAALMVVFIHAQDDAEMTAGKLGEPWLHSDIFPWGAGVDLFFIISGFIMVISSQKLFSARGAGGAFLVRRIIRIAPLYWIATSIALGGAIYAATFGPAPFPGKQLVLASYAFFPWPNPVVDGAPRPLLGLGWTLEYEMFFYVLFAAFLFLPQKKAILATTGAIACVVGVNLLSSSHILALNYWGDPIVFEFVIGMGLGLAYLSGFRLPLPVGAVMIAAAIIFMLADPCGFTILSPAQVSPNGFARLLCLGVPMGAIAAACILNAQKTPKNKGTQFLARIGDASYALYLFHPLAIIALRKAMIAMGMVSEAGFNILIPCEILCATILALAIYSGLERPMTNGLNRLVFKSSK